MLFSNTRRDIPRDLLRDHVQKSRLQAHQRVHRVHHHLTDDGEGWNMSFLPRSTQNLRIIGMQQQSDITNYSLSPHKIPTSFTVSTINCFSFNLHLTVFLVSTNKWRYKISMGLSNFHNERQTYLVVFTQAILILTSIAHNNL